MPMRRRHKRKKSAMDVAKLALSRTRVHRLRFKVTSDNDPMVGTWTQTLLNGISLGDDVSNREGDTVLMKEIGIRYEITSDAAIDSSASVRVVLVIDKLSSGVAINTNNLFFADNSLKSFYDPQLASRFRVLYDKVSILDEYAANATVLSQKFRKHYRKYKRPIRQVYNSAASTIGAIDSGALWLLFISDRVGNEPTINWQTMVKFYSP